MHRRYKARHNPQGFTLLELLMVVIIIAILASIALPNYLRVVEKSRATEVINILGALRAAEIRYKAQSLTNIYTTNSLDLDYAGGTQGTLGTRWITPANYTTTNVIFFARSGGSEDTHTVGIELNTGNICGTFTPLATATCNSAN